MITKKEIGAILEEDFLLFLDKVKLLDDFKDRKIKCEKCKETISKDNISLIYYENGYKFVCCKSECLCD